MSLCRGDKDDHCCYIMGKPCPYVRANVAGRKWSCGLLVELGNWKRVHKDPRYKPIRMAFRSVGIMVDCGGWPQRLLADGKENGPWACCFWENAQRQG